MPIRKSTLLWGFLGLFLLLLFTGAALFLLNPEFQKAWRTAGWEIPASTIRSAEADVFDELSTPVHSSENPKDPRFEIGEVEVEHLPSESDSTQREIKIWLEQNRESLQVSHDVVELLPPHYEAKLDDGIVRLECFALRLMPPHEEKQPRHWQTPAGADLDPAIRKKYNLGRRDHYRNFSNGAGTELGVLFSSDFEHPIQWRASGFRDATTKANLTNSFSWSNDQEKLFMETVLGSLHDFTVRVFATIAHGEPQIYPLPPEARASVNTPEFKVELLALENGSTQRSSSGFDHGSNRSYYTYSYQPGGKRCFGFLHVNPSEQGEQLALAIRLTSGERQILKINFHGGNDVTKVNFPVPVEELAEIELIWLPKRTGLFADLPLPALIAANRGITELLDVQIPATTFQREYDLKDFLSNATQFRVSFNTSSPIDHHFPLETEEQTVRDLLLKLETLSPASAVDVDASRQIITLGSPQERSLWEIIKEWFRW